MFRARRGGFTLIELLVVIAIIALLISILIPALTGARDMGKRAKCLSNFRTLANSSVLYAQEDKKENAIPIHQNTVSQLATRGWPGGDDNGWLRLGIAFGFGGRTPTVKYLNSDVMMKEGSRWGAQTRPLNLYILGKGNIAGSDAKKIEWFKCPSDQGYPTHSKAQILECPQKMRGIPTYNMVGNSYRMNFAGWFLGDGSGLYSVAGIAHRLSTLHGPSRLALYSEPLFYAMSFPGNNNDPNIQIRGWHGKFMHDNVGFADGSAKFTKCGRIQDFDSKTLKEMNVAPELDYKTVLRRGATWQMDGYPTGLAVIPLRSENGRDSAPRPGPGWPGGDHRKWPNWNYQDNQRE